HWLVLSPIPLQKDETGHDGIDREQITREAELRPKAGDRRTVAGGEFYWDEVHLSDEAIDFNEILGEQRHFRVAYAGCYLVAEKAQKELRMKIGSDDEAKVYLNGKQVYERRDARSFVADNDEVGGIELQEGTNALVFKVVNDTLDWQGSVRLIDKNGNPVKGVQVTLAP